MHKQNGFTIVELVVVIIVIAILATLGGLAWRTSREDAKNSQQKTDVIRLKNAVDKYYRDNGEYPIPTVTCATNSADYKVCNNGELATMLVPKYIDEIPKDKNGSNFQFAVQRENPSTQDRYGFRVLVSGTSYCKSGKNMLAGWWSSAPECDF